MILGGTIRLKDQFTGTLSKAKKETSGLTSKLKVLSHMTVRPVVRIKDEASRQIGRIRSGLTSLHGLAAMGLGVIGVGALGKATIGSAMDFETQMVGMEHWLKGNKELANDYVGWLDQFASKTPFEMEDLFPSGSRAIGVADGDINKAKRLVKLAADMAGLTPGKTVKDAMEALADAQMGEFERMKEFGMKFSKEQMDAVGGFVGFMRQAESKFAGGADKLSQTSRGRLSTITDTIKTMFRKTGEGILESMNPRLQKISDWFDKNKETVERWKGTLVRIGREASEFLFSRFESVFYHIREKYLDNPEFQNLSLTGKINFILSDVAQGFNVWFDNGGREAIVSFGSKIGNAISEGIVSVAPAIGKAAATSVVSAFSASLQQSPLGSIIMGALGGAAIGSIFPGVGTAIGAAAGGGAGLITYGISKITGAGKGHASGLPYVPYDNYPARLHRGEAVLPRTQADKYRNGSGNGQVPNITFYISGLNMTEDQIVSMVENRLLKVAANMGAV